jgi:hypothetical protein
MPSNHYHLAQVNIGRAVAPMDSPEMAGFVAQLAPINALADRSPGFVWRLQTADGNATSILPYDDPRININMSVWESVETLKEFVYKTGHIVPLRDRLKWFEKPVEAHMTMWWIPAGHIPSVDEAKERLQFRRTWGDTAVAFSFSNPYPPPDEPLGDPVPPPFSFDKRLFVCSANTTNGACDVETRFHYRQDGARVWAIYGGGRVHFGSLVAISDPHGRLDMRYHHVDTTGRLSTGMCQATPEVLPDGRLRLYEEWKWTNGDLSAGRSVVDEVRS